jgi:hypothetical protein
MMIMNIPHNSHSIDLRELPLTHNPLEQFSSNGEFKRQVILRARLEPFVELDLNINMSLSPGSHP